MTEIPNTLEQAIAQASEATKAAIADGYTRLQVELLFPELKPMPVAEKFLPTFAEYDSQFRVYFPDAGAAALARREWGELPFTVRGIGELKGQMEAEDKAFLMVAPTAVEVEEVEKMYEEAGDRPFVLLNPSLEDVAIVGIGYASRQLRDRFLNSIESCYYLRPLEGAALLRCYPSPWQVWVETDNGGYRLIAEEAQKPVGEALEQILSGTTGSQGTEEQPQQPQKKLFSSLQKFLRALSQ